MRIAILLIFMAISLGIACTCFVIYKYYSIASSLPTVGDLRERASQFETTRILDRNGNLLYEILDPNAGRRTFIPLEKISPYVIAATLATEDEDFYLHPGFNPLAMLRALFQNIEEGETVSGASTITQQLARMLILSPEERSQITFNRKVREIILAAEITRRYSKDEILELYLNEINYGNLAYGIEAAAEAYFNTSADKLTFAQASFLAGLPQAPAVYDVFANRDKTLNRHKQVLNLIYQMSTSDGCIHISNSLDPVCISYEEAILAASEMDAYEFVPDTIPMYYPHWVNYIRTQLETIYDPQTIYRSGFTVYTTLDPYLQREAERIVKQQVDSLQDQHVTNGALVAIRPETGEIIVMVGSADFNNADISGQVNMATSQTRQPGSSIKPLTYVAAFEKGWTPSTLIWDVPSQFPPSGNPADPREPYKPVNYDGRYHGPVTVRYALANSYNIPAVKTLDFVGIYDNPETAEEEGLIAFTKRLGITSLTREDYGLSLTLGGGELSLLELSGAFSVFANNGRKVSPQGILRITNYQGDVIYEYTPPPGDQVIREEHAYLITSILSDTRARIPAFGTNPIINLPFPVAAKTGTSNDFRDNWTMGYTPDLVVGVWVGNADYTPMLNTTGLSGAAPIWAEFMQTGIQVITGGNPSAFTRPAGIIDRTICTLSGSEPSDKCPNQMVEVFAFDQPPLSSDYDLWQETEIDTWTGLESSAECSGSSEEKLTLYITDTWAIRWVLQNEAGENWALDHGFTRPIIITPNQLCRASDSQPITQLSNPTAGQVITTNPVDLVGIIDATSNFDYYEISYVADSDPSKWVTLVDRNQTPMKTAGVITSWNMLGLPSGPGTLKIYLHSTTGGYSEKKIRVTILLPTLTPTWPPTPTITPTLFVPSATPTPTPVPTGTPTITPTTTDTPPAPTDTPTPTGSPTPTDSELPSPTTEDPTPQTWLLKHLHLGRLIFQGIHIQL
ncbi:MAG: transglycosylase domain-containing protein [Anaerolineaceae bacterium]|nr:transglycosylase domain-containing protein [Anaerolineaceae bacterium]